MNQDTKPVGLTRREVNLGAAWSVPVVLAAVAAPAAQGSQPPPPDTNPCTNGTLQISTEDKWQKGKGGDLWETIKVTNNGGVDLHLTGTIRNVSTHFVGVEGADNWSERTNGGQVTFDYTVPATGFVYLRVLVTEGSDNDAAWVEPGCGTRIHVKTIAKKDRS